MSKPPIIIGGCPRSGTTLLRVMLDSHPNIACGPEMKAIHLIATSFGVMHKNFGANLEQHYLVGEVQLARLYGNLIKSLLEPYRRRSGKPRAAEKTPQNIDVFPFLFHMLPGSPLIHVIRDGRDVVCSLLRQVWINPHTGRPPRYQQGPREAAEYWVKTITDAKRLRSPLCAGVYRELRYEDLIRQPEATLRALLEFIGEPWDPAVLEYNVRPHDLPPSESSSHAVAGPLVDSAIGRWRQELSSESREAVKSVAGNLLIELGYCSDLAW